MKTGYETGGDKGSTFYKSGCYYTVSDGLADKMIAAGAAVLSFVKSEREAETKPEDETPVKPTRKKTTRRRS